MKTPPLAPTLLPAHLIPGAALDTGKTVGRLNALNTVGSKTCKVPIAVNPTNPNKLKCTCSNLSASLHCGQ